MKSRARGARIGHAVAFFVILVATGVVCAAQPGPAGAAHRGGTVPPFYDRTYKCDQLERLPAPPELVVFGGSRAQRFEPSVVESLTGLSAFNFAVQNSRPEDAYAMARYLFWRAPEVKLRCLWALQATSIADSPLHPGLVSEGRLSQFLPGYLVKGQLPVAADRSGREMQGTEQYSPRGRLLHNGYDAKLERGISFDTTLGAYLSHMVPRAAAPSRYAQTRAKRYFQRTLRLFNLHGVEPVLVIMPYHPTALAAFRAVGWQAKEDAFKAYLRSLEGRYAFHLLDYTEIDAFGGTTDGFYDGAHVKATNARRILAQAVADAPAGFR